MLPDKPEILHDREKLPQQIGGLGGQIAFRGNAAGILIAQRLSQVQGAADMKSVADDTDRSAFGDHFAGKDQVLAGVCRFWLFQDPFIRNPFFQKVLFHGGTFCTGFVAALAA